MMKISTDSTFENDIKSGLVLADFWAPWCGPCRQMLPVIHELAEEMTDAQFISVDATENSSTAGKYSIMSIPALLLFKDGKLIDTKIGLQDKQDIQDWIQENL